ncbi:MAG: HAD family hydrolase [Acidobacteriota bacterium]
MADTTRAPLDLIAFDGDDTLWHNERSYRMGRRRFHDLLRRLDVRECEEDIDARVNEIELGNLRYYGYGASSFVLSLIEASIDLTRGRIPGGDVRDLIRLAKDMLSEPVELFDGASDVVAQLAGSHALVLITKGDLLHQQSKAERSGLSVHFQQIEVVSEKTPDTYARILARHGVVPERFLMIGNSLRSDVVPVARLGGWAVHIPAVPSWGHEDVTIPTDLEDRYFELDHLRRLPAFIEAFSPKAPGQ